MTLVKNTHPPSQPPTPQAYTHPTPTYPSPHPVQGRIQDLQKEEAECQNWGGRGLADIPQNRLNLHLAVKRGGSGARSVHTWIRPCSDPQTHQHTPPSPPPCRIGYLQNGYICILWNGSKWLQLYVPKSPRKDQIMKCVPGVCQDE